MIYVIVKESDDIFELVQSFMTEEEATKEILLLIPTLEEFKSVTVVHDRDLCGNVSILAVHTDESSIRIFIEKVPMAGHT